MKKIRLRKKMMAAMMAMFMAIGMVCVKADAKSVGTGTLSTSVAGYTVYVRESGSTTLLGIMYMHKNARGVYNQFTAKKACDTTTVSVSNMDAFYATSTVASLGIDKYVNVSKDATNPPYVYGSCTVNY